MAAHWLGEFPWAIAFLYAALVVVAGPTIVSPLLRHVKLDRQVATLNLVFLIYPRLLRDHQTIINKAVIFDSES